MPSHASSLNREDTMSTAATESSTARPPTRKRKSTLSTIPISTEPREAKRIKTETVTQTEPKASKPLSSSEDSVYDAVVTVTVGKVAASSAIHRGLLRRESLFFREALASSEITESGVIDKVIVLIEEDPEIFRRFKNWLYSHSIISGSETCKSLAWSDIIAVYTYAERRGIPRLQNHCVDTVIRKRKEGGHFPGPTDVNTLFNSPGQVIRLQRLLIDLFAAECNLKQAFADNRRYHITFLQGLALRLYDLKENHSSYRQVDFWRKRQKYYVGDDENPIILD